MKFIFIICLCLMFLSAHFRFTVDPSKRVRTWLPKEERLALRHFEVGDVVKVRGLRSKPHLNGKTAVVAAFDAKRRRFGCRIKGVAEPLALRACCLEAKKK